MTRYLKYIYTLFTGVRTEQDLFVRLIDSMTKQVRCFIYNYLHCQIVCLWCLKYNVCCGNVRGFRMDPITGDICFNYQPVSY